MSNLRFQGLTAITVMAVGQLVSLIGTGMTTFALTIWVWRETGQATDIALLAACSFGPLFLLTPLAGALVDRWDRKLVMMVSDLAAAVSTVVYLVLDFRGVLEVRHLFVITAFSGAFRAFQVPAFGAAVTLMVEKKHYARVNGILSLPNSSALIVAPIVGGLLLGLIGLRGVLIFDLATFFVAVSSLALIHVPPPPESEDGRRAAAGLGSEMMFGWRYIRDRKPLLGLLLTLFCFNFTLMLPISVLPPLVLARTGNDELVLGTVQSLMGLGGLVGALTLSFWGGPRRRIDGVLFGIFSTSFLGCVLMGLSRHPWGWYVCGFLGMIMLPVITGCTQAIWQVKVPPDVQGRVFAFRRLLGQGSSLPAFVLAGPLADRLFEPAVAAGNGWASALGRVVGPGPGAGLALMFVILGVLGVLTGLVAYASDNVRRIEELLPDHTSARTSYTPPSDDGLGPKVQPQPVPLVDKGDKAPRSRWRGTSARRDAGGPIQRTHGSLD